MGEGQRTGQQATDIRAVELGPGEVDLERRADGTILVSSPHPLGDYPRRLTDRLLHWAATAPDRTYLAGRPHDGSEGWIKLSYAETLDMVRRIGKALLARNLTQERPIAIISGNDLEHALLGLAAQYVGIPYAPISPAYSLISTDYAKLKYILDLLTPGLVFAADGGPFGKAIATAVPADCEVVVTRNPPGGGEAAAFETLLAEDVTGDAGAEVEAANAAVGPDTIVKFLFTSGSTGMPKGVINTQHMWCSNQEMIASAFSFFRDEPPVILDWAPWNHTAGGNHDFGLVLYNGGTFYIDDGNPTPAGIARTVRNLRDVSTNWYFNVPKGFDALVPHLRKREDKVLRERFFKNLKAMFYAGAGMAQHVWDAIDEMALETCGARIMKSCGFGATETGPFALVLLRDAEDAGNIGIPGQGVELKLVPNGSKLEARIKSPSIMPGYWRQPELTKEAFDEEGYYILGDAMRFADPDDAEQGLLFDGRVKEDFKLDTGTWVNVGPMRGAVINHFAPLISDVVIAGINQDYVTGLVFIDLISCRRLDPDLPDDADLPTITGNAKVRAAFQARLDGFAAQATGSSNRLVRLLLLEEPPSIDRHELTDKGSINQRAVLENRSDLVDELYLDPPSARTIVLGEGS